MLKKQKTAIIKDAILYSSLTFILLWILAGKYFHFGDNMPVWLATNGYPNETLALLLQQIPLYVASFGAGIAIFMRLKIHLLLRLLAIAAFGSLLGYLSWQWYVTSLI